MADDARPFAPLAGIIASAASAVSLTLLLFNGFLKDLVPPIDGAQVTIGMVSFATTIALLALSLLIRKRLGVARQQWLALGSLVLLVAALVSFFSYRDMVRTYVIAYPPDSPATQQTRFIRGELHAQGLKRAQGKSIVQAVQAFGGPQLVVRHELLWTEDAQRVVTNRLERWYTFLAMLLTLALFVVAITVWRALPAARPIHRAAADAQSAGKTAGGKRAVEHTTEGGPETR